MRMPNGHPYKWLFTYINVGTTIGRLLDILIKIWFIDKLNPRYVCIGDFFVNYSCSPKMRTAFIMIAHSRRFFSS